MDLSHVVIRIYRKEIVELYLFCSENLGSYYPICFVTNYLNLDDLFMILSLCNCFESLSTSHKLYIGMELFKVTLSIQLNQNYIQK